VGERASELTCLGRSLNPSTQGLGHGQLGPIILFRRLCPQNRRFVSPQRSEAVIETWRNVLAEAFRKKLLDKSKLRGLYMRPVYDHV